MAAERFGIIIARNIGYPELSSAEAKDSGEPLLHVSEGSGKENNEYVCQSWAKKRGSKDSYNEESALDPNSQFLHVIQSALSRNSGNQVNKNNPGSFSLNPTMTVFEDVHSLSPADLEKNYPNAAVYVTDHSKRVIWLSSFIQKNSPKVLRQANEGNEISSNYSLIELRRFLFSSKPRFSQRAILWKLEPKVSPNDSLHHNLAVASQTKLCTSTSIQISNLSDVEGPVRAEHLLKYLNPLHRFTWQPFILTDLKGEVIWINYSFEIMAKFPRSQWLGTLEMKVILELDGTMIGSHCNHGKNKVKLEGAWDLTNCKGQIFGEASIVVIRYAEMASFASYRCFVVGFPVNPSLQMIDHDGRTMSRTDGFVWMFLENLAESS